MEAREIDEETIELKCKQEEKARKAEMWQRRTFRQKAYRLVQKKKYPRILQMIAVSQKAMLAGAPQHKSLAVK